MNKLISLCLLFVLLFAFVACQDEPVIPDVHVKNEAELRAALDESGGEIILDNDISLVSEDGVSVESLVIKEGDSIILDLNGHSIMTDKTYGKNSSFLFDVKGKLVVNDSVGGSFIGGDYENASNGAFLVDGNGTLVLNDGVVIRTYPRFKDFENKDTLKYRPASVYVRGNLVVNDARIYSSRSAIYTIDDSNVTVNGGEFYSIASVNNRQSYVYALVLDGNACLNKCVVRGIHGALAIDGTKTVLNSGVQAFATDDIFEKIPKEYGYKKFFEENRNEGVSPELQKTEMFYALYCAGEREGYSAEVVVNGGRYVANNNAAYIGNSSDGGAGEKAHATIKNGTFDGGIHVDSRNPEYGFGNLIIEGGKYLKDKNTTENLNKFIKSDSGLKIDDSDKDYFVVK